MATLEDIRQMKNQGISDDQIKTMLQARGLSEREISEALSQNKIKSAVEQPDSFPVSGYKEQYGEEAGMQKSLLAPSADSQQGVQEYVPTQPSYDYSQQQGDYYQPYQSSQVSTDVITEVAEQVVAEKMSSIRKQLEKTLDLKSTIETRIEYLDERLKRIEKIIDTLQSSVLRKVGDYMTDVQDLKKEIVETQKSFGKITAEHKHKK